MAHETPATTLPPVEVVLSEVVTTLSFAAHAYLAPPGEEADDSAARGPELEAADIVIDVAGRAFDRIQAKLEPEQRAALARSLTSARMLYVKERDRPA